MDIQKKVYIFSLCLSTLAHADETVLDRKSVLKKSEPFHTEGDLKVDPKVTKNNNWSPIAASKLKTGQQGDFNGIKSVKENKVLPRPDVEARRITNSRSVFSNILRMVGEMGSSPEKILEVAEKIRRISELKLNVQDVNDMMNTKQDDLLPGLFWINPNMTLVINCEDLDYIPQEFLSLIADRKNSSIKKISIEGHNVKEIRDSFLAWCSWLESIDLSGLSNVEMIGDDFLRGCSGLKGVDLSPLKNVTMIGEFFMSECHGITYLDLQPLNKVEVEMKNMFWNSAQLKHVTIEMGWSGEIDIPSGIEVEKVKAS